MGPQGIAHLIFQDGVIAEVSWFPKNVNTLVIRMFYIATTKEYTKKGENRPNVTFLT